LLEGRGAGARLQLDASYEPRGLSNDEIEELYEEDTAGEIEGTEEAFTDNAASAQTLAELEFEIETLKDLEKLSQKVVDQHLDEVKAERLERIAKARREIQARMQREINHWSRRYAELQLQEQAGKQVRLPARVAKDRAEVLLSRLEKRMVQLEAEAQITAKVPTLKGGALVLPVGLLLALQGQSEPEGVDAAARKRVELLAMNAVFEAEKALGRMPKDVSAERGRGYDIESIDDKGDLFFIEWPAIRPQRRCM
jgi:hypothetical protein